MTTTVAIEHKKHTRRLSMSGFFSAARHKSKAERKVSVATRQVIQPKDVIMEEVAVFSYDVEKVSPKIECTHIVRDKQVLSVAKVPIPQEDIARNALNREIRTSRGLKQRKKLDSNNRGGIFDSFRHNKKPAKYAAKSKDVRTRKTGHQPQNGIAISPLSEFARARNLQLFDDGYVKSDRFSDHSLSSEGSPTLCASRRSNSQTSGDDSDSATSRRVQDLSTIKVPNRRRVKNGILKYPDRLPISDDDGISSGSNTPVSVLVTPCSPSDSDFYIRNSSSTSESSPTTPEDGMHEDPFSFASPNVQANATLPRRPKLPLSLKMEKNKSRSQESLLSIIVNAVAKRNSKESNSSDGMGGSSFFTSDFDDEKGPEPVTASDKPDDEVFDSPAFTTWDGRVSATLPRPKHRKIGNIDNIAEGKDKDSLRDLPWHAVKSKGKKANALNAQQQRPQSMMINKMPTTYGSGSLTGSSYYPGDVRVHGLPTSRLPFRPVSSYESAKSFDSSVTDGKLGRNSYKDEGDSTSLHSGSRTPPQLSQYNNVSGSIESLDEVAFDLAELENDPDLMLRDDEPEAWSVTVEKKLINKMHKKDVKRQDNIFEFIQKERNFLTTLKIMQKIFANGMARELQMEQDVIDKMFPKIDEFVEFTSAFVERINLRQQEGQTVSQIGDILVNQWSDDNGRQMLVLYSEFCSKQKEIVSMYKEMMKNDKKFQDFTQKCGRNMLTRRRDIPGCVLLVTQRITKYPVILKTLIDNSARKEHKSDCANLNTALELITDIIKKVDNQVLEYEKQKKVRDIHQKMEGKAYATYKDGRKFTKDDFLDSVGKILQISELQWKPNSMKRPIDVTVLLFKDVLVFLQENNQRYSFASGGQPASVPLHKLIVREKAGEDSVLFLISASSDKPEMYEIVFQTASESKNWMQWIRAAVDVCPEEDEGVSHQDVEEQKLMERKWEQAHQLIADLEKRDQEVNDKLQEKMEKFKMLVKVLERPEVTANMKFGYPTYILNTNDPKTKAPLGAPILQKAIEQVNKLSHAICGPGGLSRNPSSVGEHDSGTYPTPSLPKRSETFGGFDNGKEPSSPRSKYAASSLTRVGSSQDNIASSSDESKRDSGLIDGEMSQAGSEQHLTGYSSCNSSPVASGQGLLLPPTSDQISALAQLTHLLNEYMSVATQQDTQVQKMSAKMMQAAQGRRRNGNQFQEHEFKRNQLKQTELDQDLQKREEQLRTEREKWDKKFKRFQAAAESDKLENENMRQKNKRDAEEVERQQEEIRKQKEEYQREMARLRELQRKIASSDSSLQHSNTYPTSLANRNNSNSAGPLEDDDFSVDDIQQNKNPGYRLGSMPSSLSKSHSSLEGELSSGDNAVSKDSSHSPTYASSADYPKTFPGVGKREQQSFLPNQHHHSVQPPIPTAGQAGIQNLPIHLQYSATNQLSGHVAPPRHSVIPGNLLSSSKATKQSQVIPSKLTKLSGMQSSQPSGKHSGLKSKLPFTHHKKTPRSTNSSSDLIETKTTRSNTLSVPNNLKHSKSEANMEVSNNRGRSTSSPSPVTSLIPPDPESGLERSNSASSNSSKEGTDKKKKGKRRSWGSNSDKPNEKEIYF